MLYMLFIAIEKGIEAIGVTDRQILRECAKSGVGIYCTVS